MGYELAQGVAARQVFDEVSTALGRDVIKLCAESDEETLRQTQNAQIALYACGVAAYRALQDQSPAIAPRYMAGHSIGEYAALACAGALDVADGARLVMVRGELMAEAGRDRPGTMSAVLGLDRDELESICDLASEAGVVAVANDNCPGQLVISGEAPAVERASQIAMERGAKRVLPLNVSGAFHSPLMQGPARQMGEALRSVVFDDPHPPVVSNVVAQAISDAGSWPELLERQLASPVRWTESVQVMLADGVDTFIECGSGEVLSGLIRRIDKRARCLAVHDVASLQTTVEALN